MLDLSHCAERPATPPTGLTAGLLACLALMGMSACGGDDATAQSSFGDATGTGASAGGTGTGASAGGPGTGGVGAPGSGAVAGGGGSDGGGSDGGGSDGGNPGVPGDSGPRTSDAPGTASGTVAVQERPTGWHTAPEPGSGHFVFKSPGGQSEVLQGVSMTGMETGTRNTSAGAGFWLYNAAQGDERTESKKVIEHVVDVLATKWNSDIIRIPICGSAWTQNYVVRDWGEVEIGSYRDWVDVAVRRARAAGKVVIIDLHLWAIARASSAGDVSRGNFEQDGQQRAYADYEDGCTGENDVDGTDSCAPEDWYTADPNRWECAIANADGITLHNAHHNREHIADMWTDIAGRYRSDSAVWFELFNEPYTRGAAGSFPGVGASEEEAEYPWTLWTEVMDRWIRAIRTDAGADNVVIVNGLDWGYSFGPDHGPIADPDRYLPWKGVHPNIAYGFHPYQHGSCCGEVGAGGSDLSTSDPYQAGYCAYYPGGDSWGEASGAALPGGASCVKNGYAASQDKKLPPCHWAPGAYNPATGGNGICAGDRAACSGRPQGECEALDWSAFEAGGWSRYVLPMNRFGPLIATEFGSFDCSSPYVKTLLRYMAEFDISYTAWALWPQNSGGPGGLGACGYPSVMASSADGDFRACRDPQACQSLISPLPWAGQAVFDDMTSR